MLSFQVDVESLFGRRRLAPLILANTQPPHNERKKQANICIFRHYFPSSGKRVFFGSTTFNAGFVTQLFNSWHNFFAELSAKSSTAFVVKKKDSCILGGLEDSCILGG